MKRAINIIIKNALKVIGGSPLIEIEYLCKSYGSDIEEAYRIYCSEGGISWSSYKKSLSEIEDIIANTFPKYKRYFKVKENATI